MILTTGIALTVTNWLAEAVQLEKLVIVTEYVVLTNGLTVIEAFVEPLLHKYVPLPVAVKVVELPLQITAVPLMLTLAAGFTVTVRLVTAWQPVLFVTVTV